VRSIELHARNMCLINQRAAPVLRALEIAASVDAEAAELWERFQQQRRQGLSEFAAALTRKTTRVRYDLSFYSDNRGKPEHPSVRIAVAQVKVTCSNS